MIYGFGLALAGAECGQHREHIAEGNGTVTVDVSKRDAEAAARVAIQAREDAVKRAAEAAAKTATAEMLTEIEKLADEAAAAAQSFLSLVQGALGTGTRQGAQDKPPTTAQNCGSTSSALGRNETPRRHSSPVSGGEDPPSLPHTPKSGLASRFREDRARLLERLQELEQENQHLKEEIAGPRQNPARD